MAYLQQCNSYGCGVFAVMNALNHIKNKPNQLYFKDVKRYEEILDCDKEYGTQELPMIKELRKDFYVTYVKDFDKERMDDWLARGHQVILSYCYIVSKGVESDEWHYANILGKVRDRYIGVNFWTNRLHHTAREVFMDWYCGCSRPKWPQAHVMYLRERK